MKRTNTAVERFASEWLASNPEVSTLINQANWDLYNGPPSDRDGYPGFTSATRTISSALNDVSDLWVSTECNDWLDTQPCWECVDDETGELLEGENPEFWAHVDRRDVLRAIVGRELVEYVR
jgi:hypothetical protein